MHQLSFVLITVLFGHYFQPIQAGDYGEINNYLVMQTNKIDLKSNVEVAQRYLVEHPGKRGLDRDFVQGLRTFISLGNVKHDEVDCNEKNAAILNANNIMLNNLIDRMDNNVDSLTRLEKIVWYVLEEHANKCSKVYSKRLDEMVEQVDKSKLNSVKMFIGEFVRRVYELSSGDVEQKLYPAVAYKVLIKIAQEAENVDLNKKNTVEKMYLKYIEEPCSWYVNTFGPSIFNTATFDKSITYVPLNEYMLMCYENCSGILSTKGFLSQVISSSHME